MKDIKELKFMVPEKFRGGDGVNVKAVTVSYAVEKLEGAIYWGGRAAAIDGSHFMFWGPGQSFVAQPAGTIGNVGFANLKPDKVYEIVLIQSSDPINASVDFDSAV